MAYTKEQRREYTIRNKEHIMEKTIEWRNKNRELIAKYRKEYRINHKEQEIKRQKEYGIKNRELIIERRNKNRELYNERRRKKYAENPEHRRNKNKESRLRRKEQIKRYGHMYYKEKAKNVDLKHKFGITLEEYNKILIKQDNKCMICGENQDKFSKSFAVDHDHNTGKIGGLLCHNCNLILGHAKENIEILRKAVVYLEKRNG
jgi:hypothetical protein